MNNTTILVELQKQTEYLREMVRLMNLWMRDDIRQHDERVSLLRDREIKEAVIGVG